jgi:uncharacterized protein (DUF1330 family)
LRPIEQASLPFGTVLSVYVEEIFMSEKRGYVVVEVRVDDANQYENYTRHSRPAVAAFGGRYIAAGTPAALEGDIPAPRVIIVEFESAQRAQEFYRSSTYQQAKSLRKGAAQVRMYVVEGTAAER